MNLKVFGYVFLGVLTLLVIVTVYVGFQEGWLPPSRALNDMVGADGGSDAQVAAMQTTDAYQQAIINQMAAQMATIGAHETAQALVPTPTSTSVTTATPMPTATPAPTATPVTTEVVVLSGNGGIGGGNPVEAVSSYIASIAQQGSSADNGELLACQADLETLTGQFDSLNEDMVGMQLALEETREDLLACEAVELVECPVVYLFGGREFLTDEIGYEWIAQTDMCTVAKGLSMEFWIPWAGDWEEVGNDALKLVLLPDGSTYAPGGLVPFPTVSYLVGLLACNDDDKATGCTGSIALMGEVGGPPLIYGAVWDSEPIDIPVYDNYDGGEVDGVRLIRLVTTEEAESSIGK